MCDARPNLKRTDAGWPRRRCSWSCREYDGKDGRGGREFLVEGASLGPGGTAAGGDWIRFSSRPPAGGSSFYRDECTENQLTGTSVRRNPLNYNNVCLRYARVKTTTLRSRRVTHLSSLVLRVGFFSLSRHGQRSPSRCDVRVRGTGVLRRCRRRVCGSNTHRRKCSATAESWNCVLRSSAEGRVWAAAVAAAQETITWVGRPELRIAAWPRCDRDDGPAWLCCGLAFLRTTITVVNFFNFINNFQLLSIIEW